jgi:hypothetical protein
MTNFLFRGYKRKRTKYINFFALADVALEDRGEAVEDGKAEGLLVELQRRVEMQQVGGGDERVEIDEVGGGASEESGDR